MAHFARIENNIVQQTIVVANEDCGGGDYPASEPIGQAFIASLNLEGTWLQTSYNHNFRNQYGGYLDVYVPDRDVFVAPQPYPSWTLDNNHRWQAPIPQPEEDGFWTWDEAEQVWTR